MKIESGKSEAKLYVHYENEQMGALRTMHDTARLGEGGAKMHI